MAFGQAGSLSTNSPAENTPISVVLAEPLTNPIIALSGTNTGGNAYVFRVVNQVLDGNGDTTAFSFYIEEWEYLDGPHGAVETINWLAVEEGIHTLPDGRIVEAGTASTTNSNTSVSLNGGFSTPPVVLTSVMSENESTAVDSDPLNISNTGFTMRLQEEEAEDGTHLAETVGYIAIEDGGTVATGIAGVFGGVDENTDTLALGGTFSSAVSLVETQTINGGDPGNLVLVNPTNTNTGVYFQEEQSANTEVNHVDETVGLVTFESGLLVCLAQGTLVETKQGQIAVEKLETGMLLKTLDDGFQPLKKVLHRKVSTQEQSRDGRLRPILIGQGALGAGLPHRDLRVSPQHRMLVAGPLAERMFNQSEVLVAAKFLTKLAGIRVDPVLQDITYFHLLCARHQVLFAEGAPTESLFLGAELQKHLGKDMFAELRALFPDLVEVGLEKRPVRHIPDPKRQRHMVSRLHENSKPVLQRFGKRDPF